MWFIRTNFHIKTASRFPLVLNRQRIDGSTSNNKTTRPPFKCWGGLGDRQIRRTPSLKVFHMSSTTTAGFFSALSLYRLQ